MLSHRKEMIYHNDYLFFSSGESRKRITVFRLVKKGNYGNFRSDTSENSVRNFFENSFP
jgi:hypothetical protein